MDPFTEFCQMTCAIQNYITQRSAVYLDKVGRGILRKKREQILLVTSLYESCPYFKILYLPYFLPALQEKCKRISTATIKLSVNIFYSTIVSYSKGAY